MSASRFSIRSEIAEVLRDHAWNIPARACVCGVALHGDLDHGDHVAAVLMEQLDINPIREQLMLTWHRISGENPT